MTLADYLASEAAREHAKDMIARKQDAAFRVASGWQDWQHAQMGAWMRLSTGGVYAYYRPDGERYTVTDLGEGVKALRLRTGQLGVSQRRLSEVLNGIPTFGVICYGNTLCRTDVKSAMIPDAICRVMLASLRVAQS